MSQDYINCNISATSTKVLSNVHRTPKNLTKTLRGLGYLFKVTHAHHLTSVCFSCRKKTQWKSRQDGRTVDPPWMQWANPIRQGDPEQFLCDQKLLWNVKNLVADVHIYILYTYYIHIILYYIHIIYILYDIICRCVANYKLRSNMDFIS